MKRALVCVEALSLYGTSPTERRFPTALFGVSNEQGVVLVVELDIEGKAFHNGLLDLPVARIRTDHSQTVEDPLRIGVDHEDRFL